jgi:hypothetical protein
MPHLGAFVPSNYFAFIYVPVYNYPMPTPKKAATPKNALSKPVQPDAALAAVVGKDPLPPDRTDQKALGVHPQTRAPGSQG